MAHATRPGGGVAVGTPGVGGRIVGPDGTVDRGFVDIADGLIRRVVHERPPAGTPTNPEWTIVPGFVDIHVHGGGGHTVTTGDPDGVVGSTEFHRRHGTTTTLVSLVTAAIDDLLAATESIAGLLAEAPPELRAQIGGIHLEGPFLAAARCGAQNPRHMIDPSPGLIEAILSAGRGEVRVVTMAPERNGALAAIRQLVSADVTAAIGHTDASFEQARAGIDAGARLATHLGNAMAPLHHREPGAIGACLTAPLVVCELIVDGHHLHPTMVQLASMTKPDDGIALVTDAISATGAGDGRYVLGSLDVDVKNGVARLAHGDSLAGSTLTMDAAYRNALGCGLSFGAASRAASLNPARVLGLDAEIGSIEPGKRANLVVLDGDLDVAAVIVDGAVVAGSLDTS